MRSSLDLYVLCLRPPRVFSNSASSSSWMPESTEWLLISEPSLSCLSRMLVLFKDSCVSLYIGYLWSLPSSLESSRTSLNGGKPSYSTTVAVATNDFCDWIRLCIFEFIERLKSKSPPRLLASPDYESEESSWLNRTRGPHGYYSRSAARDEHIDFGGVACDWLSSSFFYSILLLRISNASSDVFLGAVLLSGVLRSGDIPYNWSFTSTVLLLGLYSWFWFWPLEFWDNIFSKDISSSQFESASFILWRLSDFKPRLLCVDFFSDKSVSWISWSSYYPGE